MKTIMSASFIPGFSARIATHLIRLLGSIALYALFGVLADHVYAADNATGVPDATRGSVWLLTDNNRYSEALMLETEVDIDISGMIARATVIQRFRNSSGQWAEGIYVFPLPDNAAVDHFRLRTSERIIEGQIKERADARTIYKDAKNEGRQAGLIEQQRANIFTTSLANIGPGDTLTIEIQYQQTIDYEDGYFRLRFPLVVGPRFHSQASEDGALDDDTDVSTVVSGSVANPVFIHIMLDPGLPLAALNSTYHEIDTRQTDMHRYSISLASKHVVADRDFELRWQPEPNHRPHAAVFSQHHDGYEYVLLSVMPPDMKYLGQHLLPRDVVFVLDVSGSMAGTSIEQAKTSLTQALARLQPQDRFNIIWFNDRAERLHPASVPASGRNVRDANGVIKRLQADGGTVMRPALALALQEQPELSRLRQIVFLTDGNVDNEQELFGMIKQQLGENRLFTVGIGSAPNSTFMRKAARAGRGTYTFIGKLDEVEQKTRLLFEKMESPALVNIDVAIEGVEVEVFPEPVSDLYLGAPLTILLRGKSIADTVTMYGDYGESVWQQTVAINHGIDHAGIHTAWAREKIAALMEQYHDAGTNHVRDTLKKEVLQLSMRHHLISRFASLVAVDVTPVNSSGSLYSEKLKTRLPHGWKNGQAPQPGTQQILLAQLNLPQTATTASLHALTAAMLFALAMVFYMWRKLV